MNNKHLKKYITFTVFFIIVFVILFLFVRSFFNKPSVISYIEYNDNISDLQITDVNNNKYTLNSVGNDNYKFCVYLSDSCGLCIDSLPTLERIKDIFCKEQSIEMILLWENKIPIKNVKEYNLYDYSYSLKNVSISPTLDTVFLLDKNNNVFFMDNDGYENAISLLIENNLVNKDSLIINSNAYIKNNLIKDSDLHDLIYFSMPGCPDCESANEIIYTSEIQKYFNITKIESKMLDENITSIVDYGHIFKKIYDIDWYPSFLILNNDGSWNMVPDVEINELRKELMKYI